MLQAITMRAGESVGAQSYGVSLHLSWPTELGREIVPLSCNVLNTALHNTYDVLCLSHRLLCGRCVRSRALAAAPAARDPKCAHLSERGVVQHMGSMNRQRVGAHVECGALGVCTCAPNGSSSRPQQHSISTVAQRSMLVCISLLIPQLLWY